MSHSPLCQVQLVGLIFAWGRAASDIGLQGVIVAFRVVDGSLRKGDTVRLMNTKKEYQVDEVGVRSPTPIEVCSSCCLSLPALPWTYDCICDHTSSARMV